MRRPLPALVAAPDYVAVALAGFSIGPMILLLANVFVVPLALLTGVVGGVGAIVWYGRPDHQVGLRDTRWTLAAALVALGWLVANSFFTSEDVFAIRDPSTYAIAGRWLTDHHSLLIDTQPQIFGMPASAPGVVSAGFSNIGHTQIVYAQGNHLLPVLLAVGSKYLGLRALFTVNIVIGALALFVLFGVVRRISGSAPLALLAMTALAASMPFIYVSRDTYSEPLTMLFLIGGLGLLHRAWTTMRIRDFALAAFVGASSAMVRVDSYAALVGFIAAAVLVCLVASPARRRHAVWCGLAIYAGAAGPTLLGWMDVSQLSRQYYWSQHHNIMALILLLFALTIVAPILVAIGWHPAVARSLRTERTKRAVSRGMVGLTLAVFVVLLSRPLWYHAEKFPYNPTLAALQQRSGVPVNGVSTYGEITLNWLSWYFGWGTVLLGGAGYAILMWRLLARREWGLMGLLGSGMTLSTLYLWNPEIYPDQPWAMRRYVPIVIPIMLVAATVALTALLQAPAGRWRGRWASLRTPARWFGYLLAVVMLVFPVAITVPVWTLRQEYPQQIQLDALCRALPHDAAVIEVDEIARTGYGQSLRTFCHVPTYALVRQPEESDAAFQARVARVHAATKEHGYTLYALSGNPSVVPIAPGTTELPFSTIWTFRWPTRISQVPGGPVRPTDAITVFLGLIDAQGLAHPVTGGPVYVTTQEQKRAGY